MVDIQKGENSFFVEDNGEKLAEITFFKSGVHEITVDHTVVSDRLRGQKVGKALLEKVVALAREENRKIVPICSFVLQQFEKHAEYGDVWAK
ncbi:GNAT family N-acetyltransferase [Peribacillus sp. SI8-4]|uniref:GNAT family N-acetyltransferase n=1 Tax=Peribacillus sp. SI8-4 TaxID=3048009 RepID=UPI00255767C3|nr:GNAT family N-acetyltransferase [Peribacillus sp. SI8-4]